jgi:protein O-GlcNAc transferase
MTPQEIQSTLQSAEQCTRAGNFSEAEKFYRQILAQHPDHPQSLHWLGYVLFTTNRLGEAEKIVRQVISLEPNRPDHICNLASVLSSQGKYDEAIEICRRLISRFPQIGEAYDILAKLLRLSEKMDQAIAAYRQGIAAAPKYAPNYVHLSEALYDTGQTNEAIAAARQASVIAPNDPEAYFQLGYVYKGLWQLDEATAAYEKAIALRPDYADALLNLGIVYMTVARLTDACDTFRRSSDADPRDGYAHSNLILTLHYRDDIQPEQITSELRSWNQRHAEPLRKLIRPHRNDPSPDRPLRIGYISPDFKAHPVGRFMAPLLSHHDHSQFKIYCYSHTEKPDRITDRLRILADQWRDTSKAKPAQALAEIVRQDEIDILVDLSLHTDKHRLLVFAQKPAPVQVSYLGYCGTTGLSTIDYRLTDPYFDPPDTDESAYSEKTIRLPNTYWCFEPLDITPEIQPPPVLESGSITFGSFNNFCKLSPSTWQAWIKILGRIPSSRLIVFTGEGSHRDIARQRLSATGIDPNRLQFVSYVSSLKRYFATYHKIDIALDPFPFCGGTTTCDALWMGVPVVTLRGQTALGRAGVSILSNIDLPELIADTTDHYIQIAANLAADPARLSKIRQNLRPKMRASPLMNASQFAKDMESAFRQMWRTYCASPR